MVTSQAVGKVCSCSRDPFGKGWEGVFNACNVYFVNLNGFYNHHQSQAALARMRSHRASVRMQKAGPGCKGDGGAQGDTPSSTSFTLIPVPWSSEKQDCPSPPALPHF